MKKSLRLSSCGKTMSRPSSICSRPILSVFLHFLKSAPKLLRQVLYWLKLMPCLENPNTDAVEIYFIRSISAYQILGSDDYESLTTIEDFCTWLHQNGENQEAYRLLMCILNSGIYGDCGEKVAETFYNMGSICFAKGELRKAIRLLRKCLMVQVLVYGSEHIKSRETKSLLTLLQRLWAGEYLYHRHVFAIQMRRRVLTSDPVTLLWDSNCTLSHSNILDSVSLLYSCLQHLVTKATGNFLYVMQPSFVTGPSTVRELKTLHKIANNKNNCVANLTARAQNSFISMDGSGRAKVEEVSLN